MNNIMGGVDPNSTHSCILAALIAKTTGPVLELGTGHYSTPLIYYMCPDRFCISIENEPEQFVFYRSKFGNRFHFFYPIHAETVSSVLSTKLNSFEFKDIFWDIVFIGHSPVEDRIKCAEILRKKAKYIICHDTEIRDNFKYKYRWGYFGKNVTTVLSDTAEIPLRDNYWDCFPKNDNVKPAAIIKPFTIPKFNPVEYIMGEKFETICDVNCEKDVDYEKTIQNSKEKVLTVFSQAHQLKYQMPVLRRQTNKKIILVTHNSDGEIAYDGFRKWDGYKWGNESNIRHWFSENTDVKEPNVTPIPMGIENEHTYKIAVNKIKAMTELRGVPKENKMLVCFNRGTNMEQRNSAYEIFKDCSSWVTCREGFNNIKRVRTYFEQMACHQFMLSPDGNGQDCIRTWEALYMGCIPIVKRHVFTEYFAQYLPIIVIDNWGEISLTMLNDNMRAFENKTHNYEMLKISYWKNEIAKKKAALLEEKN